MKAMAATAKGTHECHRRSSNRLELHPTAIIATAVGKYSVAVMSATLASCQACTETRNR